MIDKLSLTIKNIDFNSVASLSFLKGLPMSLVKKENEISPLYVFEQNWSRNNV